MNKFIEFGVKTLLPSPAGFILMQNFVEDCKKVGWKYCEEFIPFTKSKFESIKGILYFSNQFDTAEDGSIGPGTLMSLTQHVGPGILVFTLESQYSEALEYAKRAYREATSPIYFTPKRGDYIFLKMDMGYEFIFISSGDKENPTKAITGYNLYANNIFISNRVLDVEKLSRIKEFRHATPAERSLLDRELLKAGLRFDSFDGGLKKLVKYKIGRFYSNMDPFSSSATIFQCVEIKDGEVHMKHVAGKEGRYLGSNHPRFGKVIKFWDTVTLTPIGEDL